MAGWLPARGSGVPWPCAVGHAPPRERPRDSIGSQFTSPRPPREGDCRRHWPGKSHQGSAAPDARAGGKRT